VRAVAYIRVSDVSQIEGHSLDAQERLFRELCKNRGWEAVRIYSEEGRSAHVDAIAPTAYVSTTTRRLSQKPVRCCSNPHS
jgi:hypothetical protein